MFTNAPFITICSLFGAICIYIWASGKLLKLIHAFGRFVYDLYRDVLLVEDINDLFASLLLLL